MIKKTAYIFIVATLITLSTVLSLVYHQGLNQTLLLKKEYILVIPKKTPLRFIIKTLHQDHVLSNPKLFLTAIYLKGLQRQIKAGEYRLQPEMDAAQLLKMLCTGQVIQYALTIVP